MGGNFRADFLCAKLIYKIVATPLRKINTRPVVSRPRWYPPPVVSPSADLINRSSPGPELLVLVAERTRDLVVGRRGLTRT